VTLQGTAAVAAVLSSDHSMYQLSLAGCPLRDEGAMALAEALKTNISLYKLDITNCLVRQAGGYAAEQPR
jgi:Ran GTPase-activating protein (RanGAP) involved in mRNA processing and transport